MKKLYYLLLLFCPFILQSCLKDQKDIFGESPAERIDATLKNYKKVLASSENGWLLEYYPEENQSYGGFNYVVKFTEEEVKAYFELASDVSSTVESLYQLIADDGPVLSFDTYNTFLHYFATPSSTMTDGYQGDYEFILMGISDDQNEIMLKGKKTGNRMLLKRMPESPIDYLNAVRSIKTKLDAPKYRINIGDKHLDCTLSNRQLSYQYVGDNEEIVSDQIAFCYTATGIQLYKSLEIDNISAYTFTFGDQQLVSENGDVTIDFVYPPVNEVLANGISTYLMLDLLSQQYNMSATVQGWVMDAYNANLSEWGEALTYVRFTYDSVEQKHSFAFSSKASNGTYTSNFFHEITPVDGTENEIQFGSDYTMDSNATYYPYFGTMLVAKILLEGIYVLEGNDNKKPTQIKVTSKANPDIWFYLYL